VHAQQVRITNTTLREGNVTCDGDTVVITCEILGQIEQGLIWSASDQYIETGKEISFLAGDISSQRRKPTNNRDTYAILTAVDHDEQRLTSKLYINASVGTSNASFVTCRHAGESQGATKRFQVFGNTQCVTHTL
jgi:hypothetical protein